MLQKLVLYISLLPLTLNGLWLVCRNVPPDNEQDSNAQRVDSSQSAASKNGVDQESECDRMCARQTSTCLPPPGDKTSVSIVFFGVAVFLPLGQIGAPLPVRQPMTDLVTLHCDPTIAHNSPPPKV